MVSMRALQQRLAGRPFVILLVNYGEARTRVSKFATRESLELPILLDPNQDAPRAWRVRVLPSSFLLGPDGHVRYGVIVDVDWGSLAVGRVGPALVLFRRAGKPLAGVRRPRFQRQPGEAHSAPH